MRDQIRGGLRCRPGDLAIVTKCGKPERIGLLVRVIGRCPDHGYDWLTEVLGPGIMGRDVFTGMIINCKEALMYDHNLTPIRGANPRQQSARIDERRCERA